MAEQTTRDTKIVQYLNEAYGKEKELETALEAHIAMTTKPAYKKRLREHLKETKAHARTVERRIKQLGGEAQAVPGPGPVGDAASAVTAVAGKAMAAAKGPIHALRGTSETEKMLRNARDEFWNEHEEIAMYTVIETLADTVGDKETAKLARAIKREEERMAKFLGGQIPQLTKSVAREEIPAAERRSNGAARRSSASSRSASSRSSSAKSASGRSASSRSASSRSSARKPASGRSAAAGSSSAKPASGRSASGRSRARSTSRSRSS